MELPIERGADARPKISLFARTGLAGGGSASFSGSWQAGVKASHLFDSRPDSSLSLGVTQAAPSGPSAHRKGFGGSETVFELTYADRPLPFLTVQPDVQWSPNGPRSSTPGGVLVIGIRATVLLDTARSLADDGRP